MLIITCSPVDSIALVPLIIAATLKSRIRECTNTVTKEHEQLVLYALKGQ